MDWKTIKIFISSTFNDMHAERDYLIKYVFPELSEWCEERRIRLIDIDLRWGVTSDESQSNNAVRKCLENIDECRPFFLCMIGQRRGWVPNDPVRLEHDRKKRALSGSGNWLQYEISDETAAEYPELLKRKRMPSVQGVDDLDMPVQYCSVTEMEIEHALLEPMYRILDWDGEQQDRQSPLPCNALFLQRQDSFTSLLSPEHRLIYTNDELLIWGDDPKRADKAVNELVETVKNGGYELVSYSARWDEHVQSPELSAETNGGIISKGRLVLPCDFKDILISRLQALILGTDGFRDRVEPVAPPVDQYEIDMQQQEQFLNAVTDSVVGREELINEMNQYLANDSQQIMLLSAHAGYGKTTLLKNVIKQASSNRLLYRFCGVSDLTTDPYALWDALCHEAGVHTPSSLDELSKELPRLLADIAQLGVSAIVIDAVDQMQNGLAMLNWFKRLLPDGLKLIISIKMDDANKPLIDSLSQDTVINHCTVGSLSEQAVQFSLIENFLLHYMKALDNEQKKELCAKNSSGNPLYLKIVLHELRRFGSFKQLPQEIESYGRTPLEAFSKMLDRMEHDVAYEVIDHERLVPLVFGLLSCARNGLTEQEVILCVLRVIKQDVDEEHKLKELLPGSVRFILRQVRPFMARRDGRIDFLFDSFKEAAYMRYAASHRALHKTLMEYFQGECDPFGNSTYDSDNARALVEFGFHTTEYDHHEGEQLYGSLAYLDARCNKTALQPLLTELKQFSSELCSSFYSVILRYQPLLSSFPNMLFSICHAKKSTPVHAQAKGMLLDGRWTKPWLDAKQVFAIQCDDAVSEEEDDALALSLVAESEEYVFSTGCAFSQNGSLFVFAESLERLRAFDTKSFEMLSCFIGVRPVRTTAIKVSPDNKYLAIAHEDSTIELFRLAYGPEGQLLQATAIMVELAAFKPKRGLSSFGFLSGSFCYQSDATTIRAYDIEAASFTDILKTQQPIILDAVISLADHAVFSARQGMVSDIYGYSYIKKVITKVTVFESVFVRCMCAINSSCFAVAVSDNRIFVLDINAKILSEIKTETDVKSITKMEQRLLILCRSDELISWDWAAHDLELLHVAKAEDRHFNELAISDQGNILTIYGAAIAKFEMQKSAYGAWGAVQRILAVDELPELTAVVYADDNSVTVQREGFSSESVKLEKNVKHTACLTSKGIYLPGEYGKGYFLAANQTRFEHSTQQGEAIRNLRYFSASDGCLYTIDNLWNLQCKQSGFSFDLSHYKFNTINISALEDHVFMYGLASGSQAVSDTSTGHELLSGLLLIFQVISPGWLQFCGQRVISEKYGKLADVAFHKETERVFVIFNTPHSSKSNDYLRVGFGTKEEWLSGNESHRDINISRKSDADISSACATDSYMVCYQGSVFAFDVSTMEYLAAIAIDNSIDSLQASQSSNEHGLALSGDSTEVYEITIRF
ncbi:MAG: DUF4062 domain-containing protein [Coriobacteriia bacterium]|nr:DUF4062 domain-containing protein [Coriobacteriia bacterium]